MSAVRLSHVSFSYSSAVPLLTDVSFDLGPGWVGLVGANGAGKSTLLSLVAHMVEPSSGTVSIDPTDALVVLCPQRVDHLTPEIQEFGDSWEPEAYRQRAQLELEPR
jgi:ABC-type multidrug transport system ATPase subunit